MRTTLAPASTFTDAAGNNEKAPALFAWLHQARGTVVNSLKPTGVSVEALAPVTSPTQSGSSDALKLASSLSLGPPINASNGADNERNVFTKADSDNRGSH